MKKNYENPKINYYSFKIRQKGIYSWGLKICNVSWLREKERDYDGTIYPKMSQCASSQAHRKISKKISSTWDRINLKQFKITEIDFYLQVSDKTVLTILLCYQQLVQANEEFSWIFHRDNQKLRVYISILMFNIFKWPQPPEASSLIGVLEFQMTSAARNQNPIVSLVF